MPLLKKQDIEKLKKEYEEKGPGGIERELQETERKLAEKIIDRLVKDVYHEYWCKQMLES